MPKLEYFLVSESISIDRDRNQVSVFNILEEAYIPKAGPAVIPQSVALVVGFSNPATKARTSRWASIRHGRAPAMRRYTGLRELHGQRLPTTNRISVLLLSPLNAMEI